MDEMETGVQQTTAATAPEADEYKPTPEETALAKDWLERIQESAGYWKDQFDKMRSDQQFARGKQWPNQKKNDDRYVANLTKRQINLRVAAIYAKNPKFVARRRPRMDYVLWDGEAESLQMAMETIASAAAPVDPMADPLAPPPPPVDPVALQQAKSLLEDVRQGQEQKQLYTRMGKTLEIVFAHQLAEPIPNFKTRFKGAVRRCKTNGVAYVKLGYQRVMEHKAEILDRINDQSRQVAAMEALANQVAEGETFDGEADLERLRIGLEQLQSTPQIVAKEGLAYSFPKSTKIIPDMDVQSLNGFIGAGWVAEQHDLSIGRVRQLFGKDLSKCAYTKYKRDGRKGSGDKDTLARIFEVYDLENMQCLWVCDGYDGFLKPPGDPDVWTEQFHPYYTLMLAEVDDDENPFPDSDVHDIRPMQQEHNRSREALRDHRVANRPGWVAAKGLFTQDDKTKLASHAVAEVVELENMNPNDEIDIEKKLKAKPVQQIDERMYDTAPTFQDILRVQGDQEANIGPTSGATATESTIAENSRASGLASETDDVDEFLSLLARASGQLLLLEMQKATVQKIAGPGAAWPEQEMSRQDVADELYLEVVAGSSGRPNRALRVQAIERTGQMLLQVPGIKPKKLAAEMVQNIDDTADIDDWIDEGLPSITAMNAMITPTAGAAGGDPSAPDQQGGEGGNKQSRPADPQGGSKKMFPTGGPPA